MITKKVKKVISFLSAIIILFMTVCPNISLATTEIANNIQNENKVFVKNAEVENNTIANEVNNIVSTKDVNNVIENTTNIISNEESKEKELNGTTSDKSHEILENKKDALEKNTNNSDEKVEIISESEGEFITLEKGQIINLQENGIMAMNEASAYSTNTKLYVLHNASYISTTVHNRADGYGILIRKIATTSNYSDVKQAFCIEMGVDISSGIYEGSIVDSKDFNEKDLAKAYKVAYIRLVQ